MSRFVVLDPSSTVRHVNILALGDPCTDDILEQLGPKHRFSISVHVCRDLSLVHESVSSIHIRRSDFCNNPRQSLGKTTPSNACDFWDVGARLCCTYVAGVVCS